VASERDRLVQAVGQVTQEVFGERVTNPQRAKALALGQGSEGDQDPMPFADAFDVIGTLSAKIPQSIRHDISQLDVVDEHVQLQGTVQSLAQRDQIVELLGQYECFQNIQPGRAQAAGNGTQYALEIELRCPERQQAAGRRGQGGRGSTGASTRSGTTGG